MAFSLSELFGGKVSSPKTASNVATFTGERKPKTCTNCGDPGHNSRSCQSPKQDKGFSFLSFGEESTGGGRGNKGLPKKCGICGDLGHNARSHSEHVSGSSKKGAFKLPVWT